MYMPKGILKKRVEKKDFTLNLENLKEEKLGITKNFSGYIRLLCTDYEGSHDDVYLLVNRGTIVAAEKVEIERKIRTIKDNVLDELEKEYRKCEISIFGLGSREMEVAKEVNEDCELKKKVIFLSAIDREELLKRIKTDVDVEKVLSKFEGFEEKINS